MEPPYSGSNFDDFLAEEGILEEVSARALKRLLAMQLAEMMEATKSVNRNWPRICTPIVPKSIACLILPIQQLHWPHSIA